MIPTPSPLNPKSSPQSTKHKNTHFLITFPSLKICIIFFCAAPSTSLYIWEKRWSIYIHRYDDHDLLTFRSCGEKLNSLNSIDFWVSLNRGFPFWKASAMSTNNVRISGRPTKRSSLFRLSMWTFRIVFARSPAKRGFLIWTFAWLKR